VRHGKFFAFVHAFAGNRQTQGAEITQFDAQPQLET
jgi:hypothetical protein